MSDISAGLARDRLSASRATASASLLTSSTLRLLGWKTNEIEQEVEEFRREQAEEEARAAAASGEPPLPDS